MHRRRDGKEFDDKMVHVCATEHGYVKERRIEHKLGSAGEGLPVGRLYIESELHMKEVDVDGVLRRNTARAELMPQAQLVHNVEWQFKREEVGTQKSTVLSVDIPDVGFMTVPTGRHGCTSSPGSLQDGCRWAGQHPGSPSVTCGASVAGDRECQVVVDSGTPSSPSLTISIKKVDGDRPMYSSVTVKGCVVGASSGVVLVPASVTFKLCGCAPGFATTRGSRPTTAFCCRNPAGFPSFVASSRGASTASPPSAQQCRYAQLQAVASAAVFERRRALTRTLLGLQLVYDDPGTADGACRSDVCGRRAYCGHPATIAFQLSPRCAPATACRSHVR